MANHLRIGLLRPILLVLLLSSASLHADGVAGQTGQDLVSAARRQVGVTLAYDPSYQRIAYPGGDVARERGVCTDVIVRALRDARGLDLQRAVHEDLLASPAAYSRQRRWGGAAPDANIDHRRVPNLMTWFTRQGHSLRVDATAASYRPGDIVAWDLGRGILHVGVVSDRRSIAGTPLVIHNIGQGTREEDVLFRFRILGHYRL